MDREYRVAGYVKAGPEEDAGSMHLALWMGAEWEPLNFGFGVLFAEAEFPENSVAGVTMVMKAISLSRKEDGTFGVEALVRDTEESMAPKKVFWKSTDLVHFVPVSMVQDKLLQGQNMQIAIAGEKVSASVLEITKPEAEYLQWKLSHIQNISVDPVIVRVSAGRNITLPGLTAHYSDGSVEEIPVKWQTEELAAIDVNIPGRYEVTGYAAVEEYPAPLLEGIADPMVCRKNGHYYLVGTNEYLGGKNLYIRQADSIMGLVDAEPVCFFRASEEGEHSGCNWAPELHQIGGELYCLFASSMNGEWNTVQSRIMHCKGDPMNPSDWEPCRRVVKKDGSMLITEGITLDMTYFEAAGQGYYCWAQRDIHGEAVGTSDLYLAKVNSEEPQRLASEPVRLLVPKYAWDRQHTTVDEGPNVLKKDGMLFLTFSGDSVSDFYCMGLLTAREDADLLNPASWVETGYPVLGRHHVAGERGPGHNSFTKDAWGRDVLIYHMKPNGGMRSFCARTIHYGFDGEPVFYMTAEDYLKPEFRKVKAEIVIEDIFMTKIQIGNKRGVPIQPGMIGLFFEDINYAADGGLYAEMIENRSFAFYEAEGDARDYYVTYDGCYGWKALPNEESAKLRLVMGSPLAVENPHYLRLTATKAGCGIANQGYDGMSVVKGMGYRLTFWARCVSFEGDFILQLGNAAKIAAAAKLSSENYVEETYNYWRRYEVTLPAVETVDNAQFHLTMEASGVVEFAYISLFPGDAVAGVFRRDLFEKLQALKPGFLRFPGGCIVEGNTLENRYRYKESLKAPWARTNNWNRWAVHGNSAENHFHSTYSHYNQTMGLGYYELFLLCELIGAKPLPVLNVGFACQYQSTEQVSTDSEAFQAFLQDGRDLIEFANGDTDTYWGKIRAKMGHPEPFHLTMIGVGNEQWETDRADFFKRYELFEQALHACDPQIALIGSAGPDITSERYTKAWEFYHQHEEQENFVYAVDEHYYVKPKWLLDHTDFYDKYDRKVKVFSGEYAAHPCSGMNMPQANTLEGALAEAAFLTGVERNADVVVLASYAPLFAKIGYAQWSPDMIWFDRSKSYATPSYYVQQMYSTNMGTVTLHTEGREKQAAEEGLYYSVSLDESQSEIILKVVNAGATEKQIALELPEEWEDKATYTGSLLTAEQPQAYNRMEQESVTPKKIAGNVAAGLRLPAYSFAVIRM